MSYPLTPQLMAEFAQFLEWKRNGDTRSTSSDESIRRVDYVRAFGILMTRVKPNSDSKDLLLWAFIQNAYIANPDSFALLGEGHHALDGSGFYYSMKASIKVGDYYNHSYVLHIYGSIRGSFIVSHVDVISGTTVYKNAVCFSSRPSARDMFRD